MRNVVTRHHDPRAVNSSRQAGGRTLQGKHVQCRHRAPPRHHPPLVVRVRVVRVVDEVHVVHLVQHPARHPPVLPAPLEPPIVADGLKRALLHDHLAGAREVALQLRHERLVLASLCARARAHEFLHLLDDVRLVHRQCTTARHGQRRGEVPPRLGPDHALLARQPLPPRLRLGLLAEAAGPEDADDGAGGLQLQLALHHVHLHLQDHLEVLHQPEEREGVGGLRVRRHGLVGHVEHAEGAGARELQRI
mmetsp:Transcript_23370/g.73135  ORF Transcript_23370/g.73135 Transcript_23370/m.73135 type:complete len:249 (-) Transcript_23370:1782-2528(-)